MGGQLDIQAIVVGKFPIEGVLKLAIGKFELSSTIALIPGPFEMLRTIHAAVPAAAAIARIGEVLSVEAEAWKTSSTRISTVGRSA